MMTADVLRGLRYFADLDPGSLKDLLAHVRQRTCRKGETILLEGDRCEGLYFVVSGQVQVFKASGEGKEQVLKILGPGRTFNDVPVFDGGRNPGSVVATRTSTVGMIPKARMVALVDRDPRVARGVIHVLASRLRSATLLIEDLAFRSVVARVAKLLRDCARGDSTIVEGGAGPCAILTQQQIAAMTGSVREVVQRALKILEREGAIRMERAHVAILDLPALEEWSEAAPSASG
jgi:CRP/FNR family transcriptional regulator, cyclic AMP receptor protein